MFFPTASEIPPGHSDRPAVGAKLHSPPVIDAGLFEPFQEFPGRRLEDQCLGEVVRRDRQAVTAERDAAHAFSGGRQRVASLAGRRIPDHRCAVELGRDQPLTVRAECHVDDLGPGLANDRAVSHSRSLQVIPFPAAQFGWTIGEELIDPAQVGHGQLAIGKGDPVEVERFSQVSHSLRSRRGVRVRLASTAR